MPSVSHNDTLLGALGDKNKLFSRLPSGTSRETPNHVFIEEHANENERGALESVKACSSLHQEHSGMFMPSVNQNDTLLGLFGD